MSMTEQELSDVISAIIEARMSVPWQDAEPAAKALATMVKQYIERHLAAGEQARGGDDVLEMLCRLERLAVVHRVNGSVEWKLLVEQAADMIRRLATPKPAGAVPDPLDAAIAKGTKAWTGVPDSFVEDLRGEGAGRADAAPAWFGELPAPISNPEAWPANYAGGYNDALNMCYDVIRGHAPQQMTTQGEAVATVCLIGERYAHGTMIEVQLQIVPGTELPIGTKLYTGSQP